MTGSAGLTLRCCLFLSLYVEVAAHTRDPGDWCRLHGRSEKKPLSSDELDEQFLLNEAVNESVSSTQKEVLRVDFNK